MSETICTAVVRMRLIGSQEVGIRHPGCQNNLRALGTICTRQPRDAVSKELEVFVFTFTPAHMALCVSVGLNLIPV